MDAIVRWTLTENDESQCWMESHIMGEYVLFTDYARLVERIATLQSRIDALTADNERLRGAFDDEDERASVHWYGEWVAEKRRADALTADAERYRWLRDPDSECNVEIPTTHAGYLYPGHGAALDAAIDAARQQEAARES